MVRAPWAAACRGRQSEYFKQKKYFLSSANSKIIKPKSNTIQYVTVFFKIHNFYKRRPFWLVAPRAGSSRYAATYENNVIRTKFEPKIK